MLHTDVCGPLPESLGGHMYFVGLEEQQSEVAVAIPVAKKSDAPTVVETWVKRLETLTKKRVQGIRMDSGGEYKRKRLKNLLSERGIIPESTAPYTRQQNGRAERLNRTLLERVRAMLFDSNLPAKLWAETLTAAACVRNRSPVAGKNITPIEAFTEKKPDVSNLRVWGANAYALHPKKNQRKLQPRTLLGHMVGYEAGGHAYRVLDEACSKVVVRRDVIVDENASSTSSTAGVFFSPVIAVDEINSPTGNETHPLGGASEPASGSTGGGITMGNPGVSSQTPDDSDFGGGGSAAAPTPSGTDAGEPAANSVRHGRPVRNRRQPDRLGAAAMAAVTRDDATAVPLTDNPASVEEAKERPDWPLFQEAMDAGVEALHENKTWELTELPGGRKAIETKFFFNVKRDENGRVSRHNARLVAKGFE